MGFDKKYRLILALITILSLCYPRSQLLFASSSDDLTDSFTELALSNTPFKFNRWTHYPENGQTILITEDACISTSSRAHAKRKLAIIEKSTKDFFFQLNHNLFFKATYGGRANHLFLSLRIGLVIPQEHSITWKNFALCWDEKKKDFGYYRATA